MGKAIQRQKRDTRKAQVAINPKQCLEMLIFTPRLGMCSQDIGTLVDSHFRHLFKTKYQGLDFVQGVYTLHSTHHTQVQTQGDKGGGSSYFMLVLVIKKVKLAIRFEQATFQASFLLSGSLLRVYSMSSSNSRVLFYIQESITKSPLLIFRLFFRHSLETALTAGVTVWPSRLLFHLSAYISS